MTRLIEIGDSLQRATASIGELEAAMVHHAKSPSLLANLRSLQKFQRDLEKDFLSAANDRGVDVCSYRIVPEHGLAKVSAVAGSLAGFQSSVSVTYAAVRGGTPKSTRSINAEVSRATDLSVAYTYPGSLGVVLSIPNERLLPGFTSPLDQSVSTVITVAKQENIGKVAEIAKRVGPGPMAAMFDWAKSNAAYHLGTDIQWRRDQEVRESSFIQYQEFEQLSQAIEAEEEESAVEIDIVGVLVGADTKTQSFHFVTSDTDTDIRGKFTDAISNSQKAQLPQRYAAKIKKTTKIQYSRDKEDVSYFLLKLEHATNENEPPTGRIQ
jgi:hypothetical protein